MIGFGRALILVVAATAMGAGSARATVVDTGVGLGPTDPNWTITASTGTGTVAPAPAYIAPYNSSVFPFTYWSAPLAGSQWISPTSDPAASFDPSANGLYTYTETFYAGAGTVIEGKYLSDNTITNITILPPGGSIRSEEHT